MDQGPARNPAAIAVLRRALARRAVRRLLVLAGLVAAGWLIGGVGQAFADTAGTAAPKGVAVSGPGALLRAPGGIVRDTSAALGRRAAVPAALAVVPHAGSIVPHAGSIVPPAGSIVPHAGSIVPQAGTILPHAGTVVPLPVPVVRPVPNVVAPRPPASPLHQTPGRVRTGAKASDAVRPSVVAALDRHARGASAARPITRWTTASAVGAAVKGHGPVRSGASRTVLHDTNAPAGPVPAPVQAAGSSVPAAGPALFGGFGGMTLRRSWTPRRPGPVLLRAPGEVPPAVRGATDEPSFAPD
ncbi:hypothetical protein DZF91_02010 [Actinomadura logoneensis]|uniref:Uncharacterized protein n=1 Tax=Actinomadura logoneensis TaxID=2293572 RepID=A0A372JTA9_9ACTN|nr:hypothetical protein [Actinomadura logoneensis]RFU43247.1 hypothetical protein DZF91_02010 [Actinomadura logoneensis]